MVAVFSPFQRYKGVLLKAIGIITSLGQYWSESRVFAGRITLGRYAMPPASGQRVEDRQSTSNSITLFVCGDVMTGRGVDQVMARPSDPALYESYMKSAVGYMELAESKNGPIGRPVPPSYIWGDALAELERTAPDLRIINLETSVTVCDDYWPQKGINYRMHPANIDCLQAAAIDYCSLANNHVLDWGYPGLLETLETLEKVGIRYGGAGRDQHQAEREEVFTIDGKGRVVLLSYGLLNSGIPFSWAAGHNQPGVNLLKITAPKGIQKLAAKVAKLKQPGDIIVLSLHWGGNWGYEIPAAHLGLAHRLIDEAGIDVVYGHSSHHVLGIEIYRQKIILYGCGDFLNDYEGIHGYEQFRGDLGLMYFLTMDPSAGSLVELRMVPTRIRRLQVTLASREEGAWLKDVLNRESKRFCTVIDTDHNGSLVIAR